MGVNNPNERPPVKIRVKVAPKAQPRPVGVFREPALQNPVQRMQTKQNRSTARAILNVTHQAPTRPLTKRETSHAYQTPVGKQVEVHQALAQRAAEIKAQMDAENKAEGHYASVLGLTIHPEASLKAGLQALNVAATPLHAVAGAADAATGRGFKGLTPANLVKGAEQGIKNKTTYSDVLGAAGVKKGLLRSAAGFTGDILLDPTTYVTFGTTSLAREAAGKAATRVAEKALKQGMTHDVAHALANQAAKKAAKEAEGKTVGRAITAGIGKRKVKVMPLPAKRVGKGSLVAQAVNPRYVHPLSDAQAQLDVKSAHLEERAASSAGVQAVVNKARHLAALKGPEQRQVIDAIESKQVGALPDHLKPVAVRVRSDFRHMARKERQAGILGKTIEDYFPHIRAHDTEADKVVSVGRAGKTNPATLASSKGRKIKESLSALRETSPDLFTNDLSTAYAVRGRASAEGVARAHLIQQVAATGRELTPHAQIDTSKELVYRVTPTGLKPLVKEGGDKLDLTAIEKAMNGGGRHVILNKKVVDQLNERLSKPKGPGADLAHKLIDRPMGAMKTVLTVANPPYHFRNLVGDTWNSYLYQNFPSLVANFKHAIGAEKALHGIHKAEGSLSLDATKVGTGHGVQVGGKHVSYDELAQRARKSGVVDSGFYGRDIVELVKGPLASRHHPLDFIRRVGQARENLVRLNTFTAALKKGLSDREAARVTMEHHFDYGDLSHVERNVLRRIFPFYTFSARNAPLQARKLLTHPGKFAALEKLREEMAKGAGLPVGENSDYQKNLKPFEQMGMPFPVPGLSVNGSKQLAYLSLPTTDLNRLTLNPVEQFKLIGQMATPLKLPAELAANYSLFYQGAIDSGRPVSAPDWVSKLPAPLKKHLGVVYALDKHSGKHVWKWNAKADYAAKQIPQISALLQMMSTGTNRRGQDTVAKLVSQTGVRVAPYDPLSKKLDDLYTQQTALQNKRAISDAGSQQRQKLNHELSHVAKEIVANKQKQGYKVIGSVKKKPDGYSHFFTAPSQGSSGGQYDSFFK